MTDSSDTTYGFVCVSCGKTRGPFLPISIARARCADHSKRCPTHRVFLLHNGLATLEVWGGSDGS